MITALQITSVWLTATMLLVQSLFPGLATGCDCSSHRLEAAVNVEPGTRRCCCPAPPKDAVPACSHCRKTDEASERESPEDLTCHCGGRIPLDSTPPAAPGSPTVDSQRETIAGCVAVFATLTTATALPATAQVSTGESLMPGFKQDLYCVWLT